MHAAPSSSPAPQHGWLREHAPVVAAGIALSAMLVLHLVQMTFVDPDLWHEMSLARESLELGRIPLEDRFAYTPTVYPSVHHEWGTGMVLYFVATRFDAPGLMTLKYLLTAGVWIACVICARRRGASAAMICAFVPLVILSGVIGYTTIRAQVFTLLMLAVMLNFLESDRHGSRRWMLLWLPLYVIWINLHAGFVVGAGLMAAETFERWLRGQPVRHLVVLLAVMAGLVIVNPYGWEYYPYLAHALTLDRSMLTEWRPLWQTDLSLYRVFFVTLIIAIYPLSVLKPRGMPGILVFALAALAAGRYTRHLSLYLVVLLCYMPGYLQQTRLGPLLQEMWDRRCGFVVVLSCALAVVCVVMAVPGEPWKLQLPATDFDESQGRPVYPLGAIEYLHDVDFHGNAMVPFTMGGYVSWKLHPQVKVSLDGRYEVAYEPGMLGENVDFYAAQPGWEKTLAKYPTDIVLLPAASPLAEKLPEAAGWHRVYQDDTYEVYARPGLELPKVARTGQTVEAKFP